MLCVNFHVMSGLLFIDPPSMYQDKFRVFMLGISNSEEITHYASKMGDVSPVWVITWKCSVSLPVVLIVT